MTIAQKLTTLANTKQAIRNALIAKGIDVSSTPFTGYSTAISNFSVPLMPQITTRSVKLSAAMVAGTVVIERVVSGQNYAYPFPSSISPTDAVAIGWLDAGGNTNSVVNMSAVWFAIIPEPLSFGRIASTQLATIGVKADGTCVSVGGNTATGQWLDLSSWTNIKAVAVGQEFVAGLKKDGTVIARGAEGVHIVTQINTAGWTDIIQICGANGPGHLVGLKSNGTCVAVGDNSVGQTVVGWWSDVVQISANGKFTIALRSDGSCDGTGEASAGAGSLPLMYMSGWDNISAIAASPEVIVGLRSDGTICSTDDSYWNPWLTEWTDVVLIPQQFHAHIGVKRSGLSYSGGGHYNQYQQCNVALWNGLDIVQLAMSEYNSIGLKADGTCVAIGDNSWGQCDVSGWNLGPL